MTDHSENCVEEAENLNLDAQTEEEVFQNCTNMSGPKDTSKLDQTDTHRQGQPLSFSILQVSARYCPFHMKKYAHPLQFLVSHLLLS